MSRRRTLKTEEDKTDINISPMIDMVFILLIFFIVTTVFVEERGIDANKPEPGPTNPAEDSKPVKIRMAANGQIMQVVDGRESDLPLSAIRSTVRERIAQSPDISVIVEAEAEVPAGRMVQVLDEARLGGAENVSVTHSQ